MPHGPADQGPDCAEDPASENIRRPVRAEIDPAEAHGQNRRDRHHQPEHLGVGSRLEAGGNGPEREPQSGRGRGMAAREAIRAQIESGDRIVWANAIVERLQAIVGRIGQHDDHDENKRPAPMASVDQRRSRHDRRQGDDRHTAERRHIAKRVGEPGWTNGLVGMGRRPQSEDDPAIDGEGLALAHLPTQVQQRPKTDARERGRRQRPRLGGVRQTPQPKEPPLACAPHRVITRSRCIAVGPASEEGSPRSDVSSPDANAANAKVTFASDSAPASHFGHDAFLREGMSVFLGATGRPDAADLGGDQTGRANRARARRAGGRAPDALGR